MSTSFVTAIDFLGLFAVGLGAPFRVSLFNLNDKRITAEVDPLSGHDLLDFPMKQTGQLQKYYFFS